MPIIKMFKAQKKTRRFNKNQKVWVVADFGNYAYIVFKYRGKNRYVKGIINKWNANYDKFSAIIGVDGFKDIEVEDSFIKMLQSKSRLIFN